MAVIHLSDVSLSYGLPPLLERVSLSIDKGERVCLIGRNGTGKTTLLRIMAGEIEPDAGRLVRGDGVDVALLQQEVPPDLEGTVLEVVAGGLGDLAELVRRYHEASLGAHRGEEGALDRLAGLQHLLEAQGGWLLEQQVERVISRLKLDPDVRFGTLSGGLQRRVLLARALVREPGLLLLDEPTNHLDIEAIAWLEEFLAGYRGAVLFVTHDRLFLRRLATRILELDRGVLTDWPGDYDNYLRRREERLHAEAMANARFDRKLSEEEVWIRQGIKARRTRNEGRVRALEAMRRELRERHQQPGQARMLLQEAERSGRLVVEAEGLSYAWDGKPVVRDLNTLILRGDRVGVMGPNGSGKSTLLKLLLGELQPDTGKVRRGANLQIAYFDQMRGQLEEEKSVQDNVGGGSDKVSVGGTTKHVLSYLSDFLFTPERARQPVKALSGGERNRLLLAKLFTRPANVLVLDEPTNDLDAETLELLEELLQEFQGTLLLVSHDRSLLDNVVTSTLVFEGDGLVRDYVGGYSDWLRQRPAPASAAPPKTPSRAVPRSRPRSDRLSYGERRELEQLPARIEALDEELETVRQRLSDPAFYQDGGERVAAATARLQELEQTLEQAYARWEDLESRQAQGVR